MGFFIPPFLACAALIVLGADTDAKDPKATAHDKVQQIRVSADTLPFKTEVILKPGEAFRLVLPGGKEVAVWCAKSTELGQLLGDGDFNFEWGEKPFQQPKLVFRQEGDVQTADWKSYIQQGAVTTWSGGPGHQTELFVDKYRIALREEGTKKGTLPIKVQVRLATEEELEELVRGDEIKPYFLPRLKAKEPKTRLKAVSKLTQYGTPWSFEGKRRDQEELVAAIRPLRKDPDPEVRSAAEFALCKLGDVEALLRYVTPAPANEVRDARNGRSFGRFCRGVRSEKVVAHVLTFLDCQDTGLRRFAVGFFEACEHPPAKKRVRAVLLEALKDPSPDVRLWAIEEGRRVVSKEIPAVIIDLIDHPSAEIRCRALREVSRFSGEIPTAKVVARLKDQDKEVRCMAAYALDCWRDPAAIEPLLESTRDPDPGVRAQAAVSLGRIGNVKAYPRLAEMLADEKPNVREEALNGLRWLRSRKAIPEIEKLLAREKDPNVRRMAERTIKELKIQGR